MHGGLTLMTLLVAATVATSQAPPAKSPALGESVRSMYRSIARNIREAAEKMPEAHYAFRPTADVRSCGEIIGHVANTHYNFCTAARGVENPNKTNLERRTTKAELMEALAASLAFCDPAYDGLSDESLAAPAKFGTVATTQGHVLISNIAHDNEHYGNLVTYLRLKGLVPPSTERSQKIFLGR